MVPAVGGRVGLSGARAMSDSPNPLAELRAAIDLARRTSIHQCSLARRGAQRGRRAWLRGARCPPPSRLRKQNGEGIRESLRIHQARYRNLNRSEPRRPPRAQLGALRCLLKLRWSGWRRTGRQSGARLEGYGPNAVLSNGTFIGGLIVVDDVRAALSEIDRLTADCARKDATIANYEKPGSSRAIPRTALGRVLCDPSDRASRR